MFRFAFPLRAALVALPLLSAAVAVAQAADDKTNLPPLPFIDFKVAGSPAAPLPRAPSGCGQSGSSLTADDGLWEGDAEPEILAEMTITSTRPLSDTWPELAAHFGVASDWNKGCRSRGAARAIDGGMVRERLYLEPVQVGGMQVAKLQFIVGRLAKAAR